MTDEGNLTLAAHESAASRYLEHSAPPGPRMVEYLDRFADLVEVGHVLELGSGPGWDAAHLEVRGLNVTRSDAAPAFLALLHAAGHDARLLDVRIGDLGNNRVRLSLEILGLTRYSGPVVSRLCG